MNRSGLFLLTALAFRGLADPAPRNAEPLQITQIRSTLRVRKPRITSPGMMEQSSQRAMPGRASTHPIAQGNLLLFARKTRVFALSVNIAIVRRHIAANLTFKARTTKAAIFSPPSGDAPTPKRSARMRVKAEPVNTEQARTDRLPKETRH